MSDAMSDQSNVPVEPEIPAPAEPGRPQLSRGQKARDFMIGFFGGLGLNIVLGLLIYPLQMIQFRLPGWLGMTLMIGATLAPWVLNFGLITLALVLKRKWIAFGVLMMIIVPFVLGIVALLIIMVACLVGGGLEGM